MFGVGLHFIEPPITKKNTSELLQAKREKPSLQVYNQFEAWFYRFVRRLSRTLMVRVPPQSILQCRHRTVVAW